MQGGANSVDGLAEMARNAYGWNVMKPKAVDKEMWNEMYDVYVKDKYNLGIHEQMGRVNPSAMQEMTATMMETARKGYWKATPEQLKEIARMHTSFVQKYGPSGPTRSSPSTWTTCSATDAARTTPTTCSRASRPTRPRTSTPRSCSRRLARCWA